jgi:hypothetical protein
MRSKHYIMKMLFTFGIFLFAGCSTSQPPSPEPPQPSPVPVTEEMTLEQARRIAEESSCMDVGELTGNAFYNANTGTWWFDLDADKEGCNPACVVYVVDKSVEVNWRCTGALPPEEDEDELEDEVMPLVPDPAAARDAALAFLRGLDVASVPSSEVDWEEADITETGLVGSTTYEYIFQNWVVVVQYPIVNPAETIYKVDVAETEAGLSWHGEVNASGEVNGAEMPTVGDSIACWGGFIKSLPDGAQFDDYLSLGEEAGVGIQPADNVVAGQIQVVKDSSTFVHIWGIIHCPAIDYGGCYVEVTRLREDKPGPLPDPDMVSGWIGTLKGYAAGAQHDDAFVLTGDFPVTFGIESTDENIAAELVRLRDTEQVIKVWGEVSCGMPSPNGALIMVTRLEIVSDL